MEKTPLSPTTAKERHVVLDALRGLALLGIALANFPQWFRFGPLEWIWRMLTYGNYFKMLHYS
jgi:uncharacterized protein